MKRKLMLLTLILIISFISGCGLIENNRDIVYETTFTNLSPRNNDIVNVYVSGDVAIFEFVVPGLDFSKLEIVSYSLSDDNILGSLNLNEGFFKLFPLNDGRFYVVDLDNAEYTLYDKNCEEIESKLLGNDNERLSFVSISDDNRYMLYKPLDNSQLITYDLKNGKSNEFFDISDVFHQVYYKNSKFYLFGNDIITINTDDYLLNQIDNKMYIQYINDLYMIGRQGSYYTLISNSDNQEKMVKLQNDAEEIVSVRYNFLVTKVYDDGKIYLYDFGKNKVSYKQENNLLVSADVINDKQMLAIMRNEDTNFLEYKLINFSDFVNVDDISLENYDLDIINDVLKLPDYTGSQKNIDIVRRMEDNYGVRFLYDYDIFNIDSLGYTFVPIDEETAYDYMILIEKYFDYYPKGLLKEAGLGKSLIIYLCDSIKSSVGGINIFIDGYNVIYVSIGGTDEFFLNTLTHEIAHALEHGISQDLINGWTAMMPADVLRAYGDGIDGISVEYTPDDKGRTPVWFYDVYGRTNEQEDRAVIFAGMYNSYMINDKGNFKYEGLKKKADYWSFMLRNTYDSCKNVSKFKWEKILND